MAALFANNVAGLLAANIGPADTQILLGAGQGGLFPAVTAGNYYYATIIHQTTGVVEIVRVTAKSADTLTVVRGQDNTSATSFTTGSLVELRLVAQILREVDWRTGRGIANGVASLDADVRVPAAQMPTTVPLLVGGLIPDAMISTNIARTSQLAAYLPLGGGQINGNLAITGNLTVEVAGTGSARLNVGNDAYLIDVNIANTIGLKGVSNAAIGFLQMGNISFGYDGANLVYQGGVVWSAHTFDPNSKLNVTNPNVNGTLTAGELRCTQNLQSVGTNLVCAAAGGAVYLRPNGAGSASGEATLGADGIFRAPNIGGMSDIRMKENPELLDIDPFLVDNIDLYGWTWKQSRQRGTGPIAQEVRKYAARFVFEGATPDAMLSLDKAGLALEAVVGLAMRVRALESLNAKT